MSKQEAVETIALHAGQSPDSATNARAVPIYQTFSYVIKARVQLLHDIDLTLSPFNSFLFLQGLETLPLRVREHNKDVLTVAQWLEKHPAVSWVNYPSLQSHPDHENAKHYLRDGSGIKGGCEAGAKLIDSVKLFSHLANIGDAKSPIIDLASTTHQQLTPEEQVSTGVTDDSVRLSAGLGNIDDILADLDQALAASQEWRAAL